MSARRILRRSLPAVAALAAAACGVAGFTAAGAQAATTTATGEPPGTPTATTSNGVPTVGPLFDTATTDRHGCTASVVWSPRGDVFITAAHCISGTAAGEVFAPGFDGGTSPYGRWTVTAAYVDPQWIANQNPQRDFAFLTVAPQTIDGQTTEIQSVTGANRLGFGAHPAETVTIPADPAGTDNDPITCTTQVYFDGVYPAFNCNPYVGGTSGAPWLAQGPFGAVVVGVIGGLHQGGCYSYTSYSPPLGPPALIAYARAVAGAPGDTVPNAGSDGCPPGTL